MTFLEINCCLGYVYDCKNDLPLGDNQDRISLGVADQKFCSSLSQNVTLEVREVCRNIWYTNGSVFVTS